MGIEKLGQFRNLIVVIGLLFLFSCSNVDEYEFVEDRYGLLTEEQVDHLQTFHQALQQDLDVHFKLIILENKALDINELAVDLFGQLGEKTSSAKGLLFLVDPIGEQVRIEVGYDLETVFPDSFVGYLEEKQMLPFFEVGMIGQGVEATGELLISRMLQALEGKDFNGEVEFGDLQYFSGGGGAKLEVALNSKEIEKTTLENRDEFSGQETPRAVLEAYKNMLRQHIKDPHLGLFTPETREFFSDWVVTDGQQNNELRSIESAQIEKIVVDGEYAVIRYGVNYRTNSPYFIKKGINGWMLDFWTMSQVIRMNHKNQWHLVKTKHPYMFGFSDWGFDGNGFPHAN